MLSKLKTPFNESAQLPILAGTIVPEGHHSRQHNIAAQHGTAAQTLPF
jgi:hypothetical protein